MLYKGDLTSRRQIKSINSKEAYHVNGKARA